MKEEKKKIVIFSGPSGSGKDTVMKKIMEKYPENIIKMTTATTRQPREGEREGIMYYFLSRKEFNNAIKNNLIPEHNNHAGHLYGTYLPDLDKKLQKNKIIFGQVQLVGAKYLKENYNALILFFKADSLEILEKRIRERSNLSEEEIKKRIEIAKREVEEESKFYDYIIVNEQGKLDETVEKVINILKQENIL